MRRPEVRAEVGTTDGSICRPFNPDGHLRPRAGGTLQNGMEVGIVTVQRPHKSRDAGNSATKISHGGSMGHLPIGCKGLLSGFLSHANDYWEMTDTWPQRLEFEKEVKAYRLREKVRLRDIAPLLGIEESTLKDYLYRNDLRPSLEVLQKASKLFKVSITQFIDDPGALIGGQDLSDHSEETRFFAKMIVKGVATKDLTDEQRAYIIEDLFRTVDRIRTLPIGRVGASGTNQAGNKPDDEPRVLSPNSHRTPRQEG